MALSSVEIRKLLKLRNQFTRREWDVLGLVLRGYNLNETGGELHLARRTVEGYYYSAMGKIGKQKKWQLFQWAIENELVEVRI